MLNPGLTDKKSCSAALDLGQVSDFTALAVGTPCPDVVCRAKDVMRQVAAECVRELTVDGTGVGRPVLDQLRRSSLSGNCRTHTRRPTAHLCPLQVRLCLVKVR
jgi:hypothetical protein